MTYQETLFYCQCLVEEDKYSHSPGDVFEDFRKVRMKVKVSQGKTGHAGCCVGKPRHPGFNAPPPVTHLFYLCLAV